MSVASIAARAAQPMRASVQPGSAGNWARWFYAPGKFYGQAERAISTGKLRASQRFHFQPINQVVFLGPS